MAESKGFKGEKTRVPREQVNDFISALEHAIEIMKQVQSGMHRNSLDAIHPTNYRGGRTGIEDIGKFAGAMHYAYIFELGIRQDSEAFQKYVAANKSDYIVNSDV